MKSIVAGTWAVFAVGGLLLMAGCDDTPTRQVHVKPPASTPVSSPQYGREKLPGFAYPPYPAALAICTPPAIDVLVERAQADFDAGEKDFQAGRSDKAQADFDRAIRLLVDSGFQKDFDPRLAQLFDDLGAAIQSDKLSATSATDEADTDADDEPAPVEAEPAPIDEIADMTLPAADPRLALKAQKELVSVPHDLPLTVNDSVLQYLSFFTTTRGRAIVSHGLERAGRYDDMIRRVLKEEGVPEDLIYLAQAESAFQPQAVSRAGARGIWQFMPYSGEQYDLDRSYWTDERSDPEKATRAAARNLRDLYSTFGDWYLVMAAYNSGAGSVTRAIQRTGYADFWELQKLHVLPKETQNYVPIILAMAFVAKDPALYGVHVTPDKPAQAETVSLDHPIDLHLVADASGADFDDLRQLNPVLLRTITPNEAGFQLNLPAGAAKNFQDNIQQVPEDKWTSWRLHTTESGETLSDVARRYRVTVPALEAANHLEPRASVSEGFLLNVPTAPPAVRLVRYRVQRGDTLAGIADRFDVTVEELKRWNHISGQRVARGARLRIRAGGDEAAAGAESIPEKKSAQNARPSLTNVSTQESKGAAVTGHRVKPGETLYSIARQYQTSVSALRQGNPFLAERPLQAGDLLEVPR